VSRTTLINGTSGALPFTPLIPSSRPKIVNNSAPEASGNRSTRNWGLARSAAGAPASSSRAFDGSEGCGDLGRPLGKDDAAVFAGFAVKNCLDDCALPPTAHSASKAQTINDRNVISVWF
jgi:hypothetical protein